jgi:apolipoprotein D and lipocalin family protein
MRTYLFYAILLTMLFSSCKSTKLIPAPVKYVDVTRYAGLWYEIASNPTTFTKGCQCTTAEYTIKDDGTLNVLNKCRKGPNGSKISSISGTAFVVPNSGNARLKVQFFWPIRAPYWVVALDSINYEWAAVSGPKGKYLWILSRKPAMDSDVYKQVTEILRQKGIDLSGLQKTICD